MSAIRFVSGRIPQCVKNKMYHWPLALVAATFFRFPARKMCVIGVTGTNGKTTTTQLVTRVLEGAGKRVAMASTINTRINGVERVNTSKYTTLSAWQVQKFLREALSERCEYVVLEVSSHALDQYRVWGIPFAVAVITNVTREHLDYHRTMVRYRKAKRQLFKQARMVVVNADMDTPEEYLQAKSFERALSYGIENVQADVRAEGIKSTLTGSTFVVDGTVIQLSLPGRYNIENALAALATARLLALDVQGVATALARVSGIPGRMEAVPNTRGITILIDYAVTPDSLKQLYAFVARYRSGDARIIGVLGACGERDRGKRPIMGEIVSARADIIILTNEDPYHEDPERIIDEIEAGITGKTKGENWFRIFDRREAIAKALALAKSGDTVVVTGKGAETSIAMGDERISWNERSVIEEELGKLIEKSDGREVFHAND